MNVKIRYTELSGNRILKVISALPSPIADLVREYVPPRVGAKALGDLEGFLALRRGAGRNRTGEWEFCRLLPYHLATAPRDRKLWSDRFHLKRLRTGNCPTPPWMDLPAFQTVSENLL